MSSLFSAISGQFTKAIIIGALLPATVFVLVAYLWFMPMLPIDAHALSQLEGIQTQWKVAAFTAITVLVAALLNVLNTTIFRLYEGYPWKNGWLGRWKTARKVQELQRLTEARKKGRSLRQQLRGDSKRVAALSEMLIDTANQITFLFPREASVLPTRFGNVIRSFENYPSSQYGIAAIPLWPHFAAKTSSTHGSAIDDAKTSVDASINFAFLLALLALLIFGAAFVYPIPFATVSLAAAWVVKVAVLIVLSYAAYLSGVSRAGAWGGTVRSAFDLYRSEVLKDLGFEEKPADIVAERTLWTAISMQISRGDPPSGPVLHYRPGTYILPPSTDLVVIRGLSAPSAAAMTRTVTVRVENAGRQTIDKVSLVEAIATGQQYVWGTMSLNNVAAVVQGTNPYYIDIGSLAAGVSATVTYEIGAG